MNRPLTALFAAAEALLVVAIGIAIPLAPLTVLWGAQYGFGGDWAVFWRISVDAWLVGHGVDVTFVLEPDTASAFGLPEAGAPVTLTIAALGFAALTLLLAVRAGRRIAEARHVAIGGAAALAVFAAASGLLAWSAVHPSARPSLWQAALLPMLVFAAGLAIGALRERRAAGWMPARLERIPSTARIVAGAALRGGAAAATLVLLAASLVMTLAIAFGYGRIIGLYEALHTELLGGVAVTLGQLAIVPNLVIFTASWLVGPGFAIGTGSTVSMLGTSLGPIPALPVLGALPQGGLAFGFLGLLVPVVAGFLVGALAAPRLRRELGGGSAILAAAGMGLVGGVVLGLFAWWSAGSAGPGRLAHVGPDPWAVGVIAVLELGVAAMLGAATTLKRGR